MNRRGFTVIEILVIIAVMGILLTLAVVNLRSSQINARDAERRADIESITTHLEVYYTSGTDNSSIVGRYPSTAALTAGANSILSTFRDADRESFIAPETKDADDDINEHIVETFQAATNNSSDPNSLEPEPTINTYIYQPLKNDGSICQYTSDECRSYNLYYMQESDSTVITIKSKNR